MNMTYITSPYTGRRYRATSRSSLFWNKAADALLCFACTMGVIVAMFFLLTL